MFRPLGNIGKGKIEITTKRVSERVDLERGLTRPRAFEWVERPYIRSLDVLPKVKERVPLTEGEVVEWMRDSMAANIVLLGAASDYDRLGSKLLVTSNDPWGPGVALTSSFYIPYATYDAASVRAGAPVGIVTPAGTFETTCPGSLTMFGRDFLGWFAGGAFQTIHQWTGCLMQWAELASRPVDESVRHANFLGFVSPQFFMVPAIRPLRNPVVVNLTSDKNQTIRIAGRSPGDYTKVIFEQNIEVSAGESEISYMLIGLPGATDHVLQVQPENETATIINSIK